MHFSTFAGKADLEQLELCRDLARMAMTERTYAIVGGGESKNAGTNMADSFIEAFEMIRDQTTRSLTVMFEWEFGGSGGSDSVKFVMPHPAVTERFVRQTIDNMIVQRIATALYEDSVSETEYTGPVFVISDN